MFVKLYKKTLLPVDDIAGAEFMSVELPTQDLINTNHITFINSFTNDLGLHEISIDVEQDFEAYFIDEEDYKKILKGE